MFEVIKRKALSLRDASCEREWGWSIILQTEEDSSDKVTTCSYREKFLIFNPGSSITLESHSGYSEVWIGDRDFRYILEINGRIEKRIAKQYERIYIPQGKKHKIINPHETELSIFEIQIGEDIRPDDKIQYTEEDRRCN